MQVNDFQDLQGRVRKLSKPKVFTTQNENYYRTIPVNNKLLFSGCGVREVTIDGITYRSWYHPRSKKQKYTIVAYPENYYNCEND